MPHEPTIITSLQNERVKLIRSLEMRKARKETGLFVAEGVSILVTARDNGWVPETIVALAGAGADNAIHRGLLQWGLKSGAQVIEVSPAVLGKLAAKDNPQTMLGVFKQRWAEPPKPEDIKPADTWLALEEVRDPGNLGTILRTVDGVGARGIILVGPCCDPTSRECVRATMGSLFAVPIVRMEHAAFHAWRVRWTGDVVGTHLDAKEDFRHARLKEPVLLVMGSEGPGLSDVMKAACSRLVVIPMAGRLDSLNLAVATALTLYQLRGRHLSV